MTRRLRPGRACTPTPIPLLTRPCPPAAGHNILSFSPLYEVRKTGKPRKCGCPLVRLSEYLHYQSEIDLPLLFPSPSAIRLCTAIYPYQQAVSFFFFFTTTFFEVFLTIRRFCAKGKPQFDQVAILHRSSFLFRRLGGSISCVVLSCFPRTPASPSPSPSSLGLSSSFCGGRTLRARSHSHPSTNLVDP